MIDVITAVAGLLGWTAKDLSERIKEIRNKQRSQKIQRRKEAEVAFASHEMCRALTDAYYGLEDTESGLKRYCVLVKGKKLQTAIYTDRQYLSINRPPLEIPSSLLPPSHPDSKLPDPPDAVSEYAPVVIERNDRMGIRIWNAPLYRLIDHSEAGELGLLFSETDFYRYRYTSGLLADELADALISNAGDINAVLSDAARTLPIRNVLLPTLSSLRDFRSRICAGGIGVVLALARGDPHNDFLIPLQIRSHQVTDGRGLYALLPKAFHQSMAGYEEEVNVHWTVLREIYEEVFGGEEVEHNSGRLKYDWYFEICPGVNYFREHEGAYNLEVVGFGLDAIGGKYELGLVLAVRDTWYWRTYGNEMRRIWETKKIVGISSKDEEQILRVFQEGNWASESLFSFTEGLIRLEEIEPRMVKLPKLERVLGTGG